MPLTNDETVDRLTELFKLGDGLKLRRRHVVALYGGELEFPPTVTDAQIQARLDATPHDHMTGGRG